LWNVVERVETSAEECKILDYVSGYRRSSKAMLRMTEEEYEGEKLDYGVEKGSV
jgi:hypothetical protein